MAAAKADVKTGFFLAIGIILAFVVIGFAAKFLSK